MSITLYNTLTRSKEVFTPITSDEVKMYTCGPTVYARAHIGNLRTYVFEDILRRTLKHAGYKMRHVMNITDVGHLQSDADDGEDKMSVASRAEAKSPWDIARMYEDLFLQDTACLNIERPEVIVRATECIPQMQLFIQELEKKGFCYQSNQNVYFDTSRFASYADFARLDLSGQKTGARPDVEQDAGKKNPQDFVLWFTSSKFPNQIMKWESPWGVGFPGWHIECSVMATQYLGDRIDIHCGGIDHIPVHHTNEIAQSEAYHGHRWVNIWMHGNFLTLDRGKMSKSRGGTLTMETLIESGYDPLHYRYLILSAHYRGELLFSFESLDSARNAYEALRNRIVDFGPQRSENRPLSDKALSYQTAFWQAIEDDLNTPVALAHLWTMVKDPTLHEAEKFSLLRDFDTVLGIDIAKMADTSVPENIRIMIARREDARKSKDWATSDRLRDELADLGIALKDTPDGPVWMVTRSTKPEGQTA